MKKILALLLAAVLVLGMAACAASPAAPTQTTSDTASDASDTPASNAETPAASSGAKLRFVTGGESGTYYAFGSVIAQHAALTLSVWSATAPSRIFLSWKTATRSWPSASPT